MNVYKCWLYNGFDLNDLLALGPSIPKASNKLGSNPRSLTRKNGQLGLSAIQWPTTREPQYDVTILHNFFEKKLAYQSYCFFTWEFVVSPNLKKYGVRPNWKTFGFCFLLRIFCSNLQVQEHFFKPLTVTIRWRGRVIFIHHVKACKISAFKIWFGTSC